MKKINRDNVNISLQKIAKGSGYIFLGIIISLVFSFFGRILLIRIVTPQEYGIYSLSLVIVSISTTIAIMGFNEGVTRYVSYYRGKNEKKKISSVIISSLLIQLYTGIVISFFLYILAEYLSVAIFHDISLLNPLRIFAFSIPFMVMINLFISIFRGFDNVKPKIIFQDFFRTFFLILLLLIIIFLNLDFIWIIISYTVSIIITFIILLLYFLKYNNKKSYLIRRILFKRNLPIAKKLILFSLPLLGFATLNMVMDWTDTIMIGFYKSSEMVGLYNGAIPLVQLIKSGLIAAGFIFVPVASNMIAKDQFLELGRIYQLVTKWIFSLTIPFATIFIVYPNIILTFLMGQSYGAADTVLRIITIGYLIHIILGLNGMSLMVFGKTKYLMLASLVGAIINIILNIFLIPVYSIIGAAIASLVAYATINILNSYKLYKISSIHPLTKKYLKPLLISIFLLMIIFIIGKIITVTFWILILLFVIYITLYIILIILTKSLEREDIEMVKTIELKLGINLNFIKRLMEKFI